MESYLGLRAEDALAASERNLKLIIDTIPALAWSARPDGSADFFNKHFLDYLGLPLEEAKDWGWTAAVHPDDLNGLVTTWQAILASATPGEAEARLRRFDGEYRWFLFRTNPLRDDSGEIVKWYGTNTDIDERKRAAQALSASERSSRLIVDSIPGMVAVFNSGGELEFVNRQVLEYFGTQEAELKSWGTSDAVHPDDRPHVNEAFTQAIASGEPFELEVRARRFDGVYRWFQSRGFALRDMKGHVIRWYNLLIDIDERKRAEQAVRRGEAQLADADRDLRLTIDTIPVFVATYRPDGTRIFVNRTWQDYMGLTLEDATGPAATIFPHFHPDDIERNDIAWRASLASGEPLSIEVRVRRADGQYRWHMSRRVPLRDERGDIVRWYSIGIDIEDQKLAEDALRRSEAFLAEAQRLSLTGSFSWCVATDEIKWSQQLYRIFEFEEAIPLTLKPIRARIHPEDLPLFNDMIDRARGARGDFDCEYRLQMPNHSVKYLRVIAHGTEDKDGRLEYIGAAQDVSQRRLSEEALAKARSELAHVARVTSLGAMTASIAHEVNQPLAGIVTNASTCLRMLAADPPNVDGARETARRTIRDGNRAADVIARLRALFGKGPAKIERVDLNDAVREVIALLSSDLQRGGAVIRTKLADGLPFARGDRVQLQQVIVNLLRNAADAMSGVNNRPRRLLIRTEPDQDDHVRLSVQDAGVGFGPEGAEQLFAAFYTTKSDGMGIGLSVSRSIIESHNGRLWAVSNDGPGATFSFSVPVYSADKTASQSFSDARASVMSSDQTAAGLS
jgi:PAS domain S-box-containing protein